MTETIEYALTLSTVGLAVVFIVLATIALIVASLKRMDSKWHDYEYKEDASLLRKTQNIDDTTLILISSAVATVVRQKFRIKNIRVVKRGHKSQSWAAQGRGALHASHSLNKK